MSDDKEIANRVARILRLLALKIESDPDILKDTGLSIIDAPKKTRKHREEKSAVGFDVFQVFAESSGSALRTKLMDLDLRTLRKIISEHGFDPSKLAGKWKNKEKLIDLIIDRVSSRSEKGGVFKNYP
jgi:hypothetical protein